MAEEEKDETTGSEGVQMDELSDDEREAAEAEEADAWKPPTQAEYNKIIRASQRAAKDLAKLKESQKATPSDDDVETAVSKAREETEAKYKTRVVKAEARALLTSAGAKGDLAVLVRMIDLNDVDVDDDGEVDGLESQIDDLKDKVPNLFEKRVKADPRTRADASDKTASKPGKSSADRIADLMRSGK